VLENALNAALTAALKFYENVRIAKTGGGNG
jgi:hypothetical protein